jgi:hypothetical protein
VKLPGSIWRSALPIVGYIVLGAVMTVVAAVIIGAWIALRRGP